GGRSDRPRRLDRGARRLSLLAARDGQRRDRGSCLPARRRGRRDRRRPRRARRGVAMARTRARAHAGGLRLPRGSLASPVRRVPWDVQAVSALIVLDGAAVIEAYSRFSTHGSTTSITRHVAADDAAGVAGLHHAGHHGQHHGWQATMLSLTALAFSRLPRPRILNAYLSRAARRRRRPARRSRPPRSRARGGSRPCARRAGAAVLDA